VSAARVANNVRLKRVYEPASPDDGYRVLATRYWPRGVRKDAADEYTTKVAPSRELLREFKHEGLTWEQYVPRYLDEMRSEAAISVIQRLAAMAISGSMTLMCICEDENRCHRRLLRDLIIEAAG
jgi:uncharacterized protein YeaO (DUF488 family)